jgi:hypothetical protein
MGDCFACKGRNPRVYCGREFCPIYQKLGSGMKKVELDFSGTSPPDVFVGRHNYPNVFTGILSPLGHVEGAERLSCPEEWFARGMGIEEILASRGSLIYSRFVSPVKSWSGKLIEVVKEISMAQKPCDAEFHLEKKPSVNLQIDRKTAPIGNVAPLRGAFLTSNPKIPYKVDYVVSDGDLKTIDGVMKLYSEGGIQISGLIRLLSAGMLGLKKNRKLTPSRWATTAIDSIISDTLIERIKRSNWVNEYLVFHGDYVGNHYEFILIPRNFSFEVIEARMSSKVWNPSDSGNYFMQDYEGIYKRKEYAKEVSGGYYSNRLAAAEYLHSINRQASVLVLREIRQEYYAPLGVGILRELSRSCFRKKPEKFNTLNEALRCASSRMRVPIGEFSGRSRLLKDIKEQSCLARWVMK